MGACCVHACLLFIICCMLSAACSPLHIAFRMLCAVYCMLSFACCQAAADALQALTTAVCAELSAPPPIVRDTCLLVRSALADEVCAQTKPAASQPVGQPQGGAALRCAVASHSRAESDGRTGLRCRGSSEGIRPAGSRGTTWHAQQSTAHCCRTHFTAYSQPYACNGRAYPTLSTAYTIGVTQYSCNSRPHYTLRCVGIRRPRRVRPSRSFLRCASSSSSCRRPATFNPPPVRSRKPKGNRA